MTFFSLSKQINVVAKFTKSTWKMTKMNQLLWLLFFSIPQSNGTKVPQEQGIKSYIKLLNIILNYIIVNDIKLC